MEMNCEHGISIYHDCDECTALYAGENQVWETKQIRRELASVELRIVSANREREAERRRRISAEATASVFVGAIRDDGFAMTFQSVGQYRAALLMLAATRPANPFLAAPPDPFWAAVSDDTILANLKNARAVAGPTNPGHEAFIALMEAEVCRRGLKG